MLRNGSSLRSYNDFSGRNGSGHCGDATMPRDYPGGLIETMNGGVRARSCAAQPPSDRKTPCLENPRLSTTIYAVWGLPRNELYTSGPCRPLVRYPSEANLSVIFRSKVE